MLLQVVNAKTYRQLRDFYRLPYLLHASNPNWVPPLRAMVKQYLDVKKNPFYQHAKREMWVAYRGKKPVGRIVGILNTRYNVLHQEAKAFFGFFEVEHSAETAKVLFSTVEQWALQQELTSLSGPVNPSMNHECGLQISAFESQPFFMMPQNPPYYQDLIEAIGYKKAKDMSAWLLDLKGAVFHPRLVRYAEQMKKEHRIKVSYLEPRLLLQKSEDYFQAFNEVWEGSWGFVPMTRQEFHFLCKEMQMILLPTSILSLEIDGELAACGIWVPNVNRIFSQIKNGRLFPSGLLKLFWYTKVNKDFVLQQGRIPLLGVRKKFRHLKLGPLLYTILLKDYQQLGCSETECSWVFEDNRPMQAALRLMAAKKYKTYRIYTRDLAECIL